jgi:hypothetical protein
MVTYLHIGKFLATHDPINRFIKFPSTHPERYRRAASYQQHGHGHGSLPRSNHRIKGVSRPAASEDLFDGIHIIDATGQSLASYR